MNSVEAVSVSKIFDVNSTDAAEAEIAMTSSYDRCSHPALSEAIKKAREQVSALISTEVDQQAEIDELLQETFFKEAEYEFQIRLTEDLRATCLIASEPDLYRSITGSRVNDEQATNLALITSTRTVSSVIENYTNEKVKGRSCAVHADNSTTCEALTSHIALASAPFIKLAVKNR
jgi:hypothetical protein